MQNLKNEGKKRSTSKYANNCAHSLVVLILCVFGTCRAFLVPVEVFLTWCPHVDFSCAPCLFASRALELMLAQFLPLILMGYAVRPVQRLSCDRHPDHSHRHHIDSWQRSYGFYIFTKSYDSMEISGEDGQTNSAGARPTGRDLQQHQEWWNQMPMPDDQMQEPDWWNQTHLPSHHFGEQERSGRRPAPADSTEASASDADAADEHSLSLWSTFGKQCA